MRKEIVVCDLQDKTCKGEVEAWHLLPPGGRKQRVVDLCDTHAAPFKRAVEASSRAEPLPPRPTHRVQRTTLLDGS